MSKALAKSQDNQAAQASQPYPQERQLRYPPVDISEGESEFIIEADMPGVREENINVHFHQGELTIRGIVEVPQSTDNTYRFRQFESTDFYRAFRIGESVDAAKISAYSSDGVLTVHLPKAEKLMPHKIDVSRK